MSRFSDLFSTSGLSLERLYSFLLVAEAGSIAEAADRDPVRQSQYSRQIKELETFFGTALTRRIGRRIEITQEGHRLATLVRTHFSELSGFYNEVSGRPPVVRMGASGSIIQWQILPRLAACRAALGDPMFKLTQLRTAEILRDVSTGSLDFGLLRLDALPENLPQRKLGSLCFALFAPTAVWKKFRGLEKIITQYPMATILPGGNFSRTIEKWLIDSGLQPTIHARVSSFVQLARLIKTSNHAAILPSTAAVEFNPDRFRVKIISKLPRRHYALIWNARSLEQLRLTQSQVEALGKSLQLPSLRS